MPDVLRKEYRVFSEEDKLAMNAVKEVGGIFLSELDKYVHPSREASLAKTKLEEAVMWAVKGITG